MHIIVCIKQIQDPEIASSVFRVNEEAKAVVPIPGMTPVISPFDEQAVEAALRIRDTASEDAEIKITVLTMGPASVRAAVKGALSLGADEAVMLTDAAFDGADSFSTASALAKAIDKIGGYDLIITGRQAADWDAGVVGLGIAEILDIPAVTFARAVRVEDGAVQVERVLDDGIESVTAPMPAVVTVSNELGTVRHASMRETMRAAKKPMTVWTAEELGADASVLGAAGARRTLERLYIPANDIVCEYVDGETPQEMAVNLARRLHEADLI